MTTDAAHLVGPPQEPPRRTSFIERVRRRHWFPYLMVAPALIVVLGVVVYPMAYSLYVSFTGFHLLRPDTTSQFVAVEMFDNYARLARDDVFWRALGNTILFMVVTVNGSLVIGFGMAMLLARMTFALGPARVLLMIPMMFAPVLVGFQFSWFFNATVGLVNNALITLGVISEPIAWLVSEPHGMISIMVATIWMTVPVVTIVLLAGRLSLSEELYDAASVDGASIYQRLRHITIPQMRPFFVIVLVLLSLDIARAYDIVRMMTAIQRHRVFFFLYRSVTCRAAEHREDEDRRDPIRDRRRDRGPDDPELRDQQEVGGDVHAEAGEHGGRRESRPAAADEES